MTELRIAILGSGYMGRTYAECISKFNTRARLVAVCGGRRAPGLAADYGLAYEPTYDGLLARPDVDAVLIATPHADHRDQVIQAAAHGKHVLVEKPMATTVADCDAMIAACWQAGVVLEVIQTLRFRGTPARAKQLIDAGRIGAVRMIRGQSLVREYDIAAGAWPGLPEHGGAFLDMGVHNFDIMRFWSGSEARRVFAHITTYGDSGYPWLSAMTQIVFANGIVAQQWTSHEIPAQSLTDSQHRYVVVGESGALEIDGYGKLLLSTPEGTELVWEQPPFDFVNRPLDPVRLEAFYTQTQSFVDDVLDGRPPTVPGAEGRAAVEIVEAARRSSETDQAIGLPLQ
ncbi:MAG TPA: Gfo/Idh/MocA family oxidoreductase [Roseiflexaceae bacterium]